MSAEKITKKEFLHKLRNLLRDEDLKNFGEIFDLITKFDLTAKTYKKNIAAVAATDARVKRVKEKINNAINLLKLENKKLNFHNIAKTANVAYVTVRKYLSKEDLNKLNSY